MLLFHVCVLFHGVTILNAPCAEFIELVDETLKVLHEMLRTWSNATAAAINVRASLDLPPSPPQVEYMSPAWKLPIELPSLPSTGSPVPDKARFIQEAITMLMIFLDEINAEGDEYIRQARKMVLLRLEAVSTGAEAWVRDYERVARIVEEKARRNAKASSSSTRRDRERDRVEKKSPDSLYDAGTELTAATTHRGDDDACSCSECDEDANPPAAARRGGRR